MCTFSVCKLKHSIGSLGSDEWCALYADERRAEGSERLRG